MATTFTNVRPGDLISSNLMNFVLTKLQEFDTRISKLETASAAGDVQITGFDPPNQQNAGQQLTIFGNNFALPGTSNSVTLNDTSITAFQPNSSTTQLVFIIPASFSPPAGGNVTVTVSNSNGKYSALYVILPAIPVTGPNPQITGVSQVSGSTIFVGQQIRITGNNFPLHPADNALTFQVAVASGPVTYPKPGNTVQIDMIYSNAQQIICTLPDITEITSSPFGFAVVTVSDTVGAHPPAAFNFTAFRQ